MELGEVEQEIFCKYKPALVAIGVNLDNWEVIEAIEGCAYELESKFQAVIGWYVWLRRKHERDANWRHKLPFFTDILVRAFREQWQPIAWKDEFLSLDYLRPRSALMREKLQSMKFLRYVSYEVRDDSDYVRFFEDGRMVWELAVEDGLAMSAAGLFLNLLDKTNAIDRIPHQDYPI